MTLVANGLKMRLDVKIPSGVDSDQPMQGNLYGSRVYFTWRQDLNLSFDLQLPYRLNPILHTVQVE